MIRIIIIQFVVFINFLTGQKKFIQRKVFFYSANLNEENNYTITKNNEVIHNIWKKK